jgi:hypothetical protein
MSDHAEAVKNTLDVVAIVTTVGAFLNLFTPIFALIGAIVGVMRIAEMATGKDFSELLPWNKKADDAVNK